MTEYLLKIVGLSVFSIVLTNILPTKKLNSLIKNLVRLCLYGLIIAPIASFCIQLKGTGEGDLLKIFPNYFSETVIEIDQAYIKYCSEKSIQGLEQRLAEKILEDYKISVKVDVVVKNNNAQEIERICIIFTEENDDLLVQTLKDQLQAEYSIPVEILKEVKE